MFNDFARVWTPVTRATSLRADRPLPLQVAGERIVFFRDAAGHPAALIDRCPHRGVQLSLGKLRDGCIECPFHAWQFDGRGRATHIPLNPDARKDNLAATALPVVERGGLLWLFTAPAGSMAAGEPEVPDALTRPGLRHTFLEVAWNAHWTRAMENMLDSPHVPFVHRKTIGRFVRPFLKHDSRMDITWEETPYGGRTRNHIEGQPERDAYLDWYRPNIMVLNIPIPGKVFRLHALCVPISPTQTRMIVVGARSFATLPWLDVFFNRSNRRIVDEDRAVVESSWPMEVPPPADEVSVRTDKATLQFRRWYLKTLKGSSVALDDGALQVPNG